MGGLRFTMLGANLSDQIPGGPNLTLTLTLVPKFSRVHDLTSDLHLLDRKRQLTLTCKSKTALGRIKPDTDTDTEFLNHAPPKKNLTDRFAPSTVCRANGWCIRL